MEVVPTELVRAAIRIEVRDQVGVEKSERSAASRDGSVAHFKFRGPRSLATDTRWVLKTQ
jgi:hypothetical protein